jgi:hypothetical protein
LEEQYKVCRTEFGGIYKNSRVCIIKFNVVDTLPVIMVLSAFTPTYLPIATIVTVIVASLVVAPSVAAITTL